MPYAIEHLFGHITFALYRLFHSNDSGEPGRMQAEGLNHISPGQRPGVTCPLIGLQANGLLHFRRHMSRGFSAHPVLDRVNPGRCLGWYE